MDVNCMHLLSDKKCAYWKSKVNPDGCSQCIFLCEGCMGDCQDNGCSHMKEKINKKGTDKVANMKLEIKLADIDEVRTIIEQDSKDIEDLLSVFLYFARNDAFDEDQFAKVVKIAESRGYTITEDLDLEYKGEIV